MSEDWNELIGNLIGVAMWSWQSNEGLNTAHAALLSAIEAVEQERDALQESFDECMRQYDHQQKRACNAESALKEAKSQLAEAEAELSHYRGFVYSHPWMEYKSIGAK